MMKTIAVTELEGSVRAVLDEVADQHVAYVLTRGLEPHPAAALVPYKDYQRLQQLSESEILRRFDETKARIRARLGSYSDEEITADVAMARRELPD